MPLQAYCVVVNGEEQYSIWPLARALPAGWTAIGVEGDRETCLRHIELVWTDLTPKSARRPPHADG